jgi:hypothetical protein
MLSKKIALTPFLLMALPAWAAYDANGIALGASEKDIARQFPVAHCKPLQWTSRAADRRCDDARASFGGADARITFYLKDDKVQAFDVRFDSRDAERVATFLKSRYGKPSAETREKTDARGRAREVYRVRWDHGERRAVLTAPMDRRRASLTVSVGNFEDEIYRVR